MSKQLVSKYEIVNKAPSKEVLRQQGGSQKLSHSQPANGSSLSELGLELTPTQLEKVKRLAARRRTNAVSSTTQKVRRRVSSRKRKPKKGHRRTPRPKRQSSSPPKNSTYAEGATFTNHSRMVVGTDSSRQNWGISESSVVDNSRNQTNELHVTNNIEEGPEDMDEDQDTDAMSIDEE